MADHLKNTHGTENKDRACDRASEAPSFDALNHDVVKSSMNSTALETTCDKANIILDSTVNTAKNNSSADVSNIAAVAHTLRNLRVGLGYDVHAFAPDRKLILGGVDIPHHQGLDGHSDADVLLHAISDALLGATRLGDIGKLFPDTDPAYKGADSLKLLEEVVKVVRKEGFEILDIDCVIAAQAPKLSPHREAMRENVARACGLLKEHIGIKATTTEHLGFEGREEGISAQAVALVMRCC